MVSRPTLKSTLNRTILSQTLGGRRGPESAHFAAHKARTHWPLLPFSGYCPLSEGRMAHSRTGQGSMRDSDPHFIIRALGPPSSKGRPFIL